MPPAQINAQDEAHLRLISVFHYVLAGLHFLGIGFIVIHFMIMKFAMEMAEKAPPPPPAPTVAVVGETLAPVASAPAISTSPQEIPDEIWWIMGAVYLVIGLLLVAQSVANVLSGIWISKRKNRTFSYVIAGLNCMFFPFGTALGVFTFIVLSRLSIASAYEARKGA